MLHLNQIETEIFKSSEKATAFLTKLINQIYVNQEKLHEDWVTDVALTLHKKGSKQDTNNYRLICVKSHAAKIYTRILKNRLSKHIERMCGDYQNGFRRNRSTSDNYFVMNIILNERIKKGKELHVLFIGYRCAIESI